PATDHGPAATQQMVAAPAVSMPAATGEASGPAPPQQASLLPVAIAQPSHAAPDALPLEGLPQIAAAFSGFMQANVSMSDHAATAFSKVGTHIEAIYNSIVFLGDNIAVANALNFAPLSQLNQLAGAGGGAGNFSQLSNLAVSDNDATAVAIAGTWIDYAYNSIIVVGANTAVANATNIAPATQVNMALFDDLDDASFGSIHESNFLLSDNDSTANSQAGIYVGEAGGSLASGIAPPSYASDALFDDMLGYPNWSDTAEA
ncbi:MAG TPA: hypothetical protein VLQ65_01615, partial [Saliniramus sp.]|nr:hypothetical protein [Saliniramus sp.]